MGFYLFGNVNTSCLVCTNRMHMWPIGFMCSTCKRKSFLCEIYGFVSVWDGMAIHWGSFLLSACSNIFIWCSHSNKPHNLYSFGIATWELKPAHKTSHVTRYVLSHTVGATEFCSVTTPNCVLLLLLQQLFTSIRSRQWEDLTRTVSAGNQLSCFECSQCP